MRLHVLDGGTIDILDWSLFDPTAPPGSHRRLASPAYLVEHPSGTLLWDAGLGDDLCGRPGGLEVESIARFTVEARLTDQLAAVGYAPDRVTHLALSHFHPDHVGNANLFAAAELLVQDEEYDAAFGPGSASLGYEPSRYQALGAAPVTRLHGDHDVFGDGTVVIKRFPGHTPGGQSLLLRLPHSGAIFISGDLAHSRENWEQRLVPGLNFSAEATLDSLARAHAEVAALGAEVWIQHDYDNWMASRHAPAFYE